jgi:EAL domain-containing protein (putative c-di-GMP-specific phosphodiesterase class I)
MTSDARPCAAIIATLAENSRFRRMLPDVFVQLESALSARLSAALRSGDSVYRLTAGEWLLQLPDLRSPAMLELALLKLERTFADLVLVVGGQEFSPRLQFGGALWPDDAPAPLELVQAARIAVHHQSLNPGAHARFVPEMESDLSCRQEEVDRAIRKSLLSGQGFRLFLQPKIRLDDERCDSAEALLRFALADDGWMPPLDVLASIDQLNLRSYFTRWLFMSAAENVHALADVGIDIQLSLNLSAGDLHDVELPALLSQALDTRKVAPASIRLEITETGMVDDTATVRAVLHDFRARGVSLSIDDFGTGFSTMSYLRNLPVQEVKIDQSFIRNATESQHDREIISAVVQLANRLGIEEVTAEGVETSAVAQAVKTLGCRHAQGYLYSPALPLAAFIEWHRNWNGAEAIQPAD